MKSQGFIKVPKQLLKNKKFKKLKNTSKILLIYLLLASNTFRNKKFFIYHNELHALINISRVGVWRASTDLKKIGVSMISIKKQYHFDLTNFYNLFPKDTIFVSKMKQ